MPGPSWSDCLPFPGQTSHLAPCQSWRTCGRDYEIIEYETSSLPRTQVKHYAGLEVSAKGIAWGAEAPQYGA